MTADTAPSPQSQLPEAPITQEKAGFRAGWPVWLKQMPRLRFPPPNENFQLIDRKRFDDYLKTIDPEISERLRADIEHMDYELLRLFRRRDYEAKFQQNRYRLYQISYTVLATSATLVGSLMALSIHANPNAVIWLGFLETLIALLTTYLATISGREAPLPLWLSNRRRAELLRREYFRFLMNLAPYDEVEGYEREMLLSRRAADINRGSSPTMETKQ